MSPMVFHRASIVLAPIRRRGLEFGEGHFDRIEIGTVGRQEEEPGARAPEDSSAWRSSWLARLSRMTTPPLRRLERAGSPTSRWRKSRGSIGWSITHGAVRPSQRSPAMKVWVAQCRTAPRPSAGCRGPPARAGGSSLSSSPVSSRKTNRWIFSRIRGRRSPSTPHAPDAHPRARSPRPAEFFKAQPCFQQHPRQGSRVRRHLLLGGQLGRQVRHRMSGSASTQSSRAARCAASLPLPGGRPSRRRRRAGAHVSDRPASPRSWHSPSNRRAAARRDAPPSTTNWTRSPISSEQGLPIPAGLHGTRPV